MIFIITLCLLHISYADVLVGFVDDGVGQCCVFYFEPVSVVLDDCLWRHFSRLNCLDYE
jgi:hypothetical protein